MTREWIEPIFDRTYGHVQSLQEDPNQEITKGAWNAEDLNRIENNTAYCADWMLHQKIVRAPIQIMVRDADYWQKDMIPTKVEIDRILLNIRMLVEISKNNPAIAADLPDVYAATQINYVYANQIEFALDLMHDQPKLPLQYWKLKITNGVVASVIRDDGSTEVLNTAEALVAENEIVTITGVEYGEYAEHQDFTYWSGKEEDLGLLNNYKSKTTTFEMPFRDVEFTANFETHIPRKLKINSGYISIGHNPSAESGPSEGTYLAGDEIMIIANIAASGKAFYEWLGTPEAIEHIVGVTDSEDPSTAILTMPDCDVELSPHYINAGKHQVSVSGGSGGGWYDYNEYVSIYPNTPDHYAFSHWSGNTSYLEDIYQSSPSFKMGDVNISFRAHFNYVYSYNNVQIINAKMLVNGQEVNKAEGLREATSYQLIPTPPDETQGVAYWQIEGAGSTSGNTFTVGDGNAIITAHYGPLRNVEVVNRNNNGQTTTSTVTEGNQFKISTSEEQGDYIFVKWLKDNTNYSSNTTIKLTINTDTKLEAVYRPKETYRLTVNSGSGSGVYKERQWVTIKADEPMEGASFVDWTAVGVRNIDNRSASSTRIQMGRQNATCTANYNNIRNIKVTTNSGASEYRVIQGKNQRIVANPAPSTWEFKEWKVVSGDATLSNYLAETTYVYANAQDSEIEAMYQPIPYFTVNIENGYIWDGNTWTTSATLLRNSTNAIKMKPAPTGHQFLQWEVYVDGVLQTDANDVSAPLAEQTTLRNLLRDMTLKATYYIPDENVKYTLTVERKDGSTQPYESPAGEDVDIYASAPDEGMEFHKWTGDTAYIAGGIYNEESYVHMPAQNIMIKENFVPKGYIPKFSVIMSTTNGECCYETTYTDPETGETTVTENWTTRYDDFEEGSMVKIRAVNIDREFYFSRWRAYNFDTQEEVSELITHLTLPETTIQVPDFDIIVEPKLEDKVLHQLTVIDGERSGPFYEGDAADIWFSKQDTDDMKYTFLRWTGTNIAQLELYDGGIFDVLEPGTSMEPQQIKMPDRSVEIRATYDTSYRLTLIDGIIDKTGESEGFFKSGTKLEITANSAPEGMKFQYWEGDTDKLASKYDPTTTVTTATGTTNLKAVYSTDAERNSVGYVETSLMNITTINNSDITVISGEISVGFMLTDSNGHVYIITHIDETTGVSTIYRMTKIVQGGNMYG